MPRISPLTGLRSLQSAIASSTTASARSPFAAATRAISTSTPASGRNTEWVRGKLWKGDAPGPEDPYTQRSEPLEVSNLPDEALGGQLYADSTQRAARNTRLAFPPRRSEATAEKEISTIDPTYTPASTIEDLEDVGPLKSWWEQPGHWGQESEYRGFANTAKVEDQAVIEVYLRRALVESLALRKDEKRAFLLTKRWREGERSDLDRALAVEIVVSEGQPTLKGSTVGAVARSLNSANNTGEPAALLSAEEAAEIVKAWDPSWKTVALDEELKFAIRKRLYQLTGNLIPDAKLGAARTIKHLLTLAAKQPAPKKLVETLEKRGDLQKLPNVSLHSRRVTPIDKEVALGRWKVIEEELKKRDLPVTGTNGARKNKEMDWMLGNE